ncbi:alpha/beta fold hydrolase [Hoyosella altamirensis]|uniref:Pimeloyl-ACP methyl ester carboxylesterase n=1 Tax=Hoyosella altamirensis TaxID=616997 RepID=A0A839RTL5_9ACTN|nr:alpha/beta hydrolase [Hoyosella altamirensis]MBB3039910.1 pimeloyl-ACP methyl ester carboxylesterase [Hoyosella altamirensis]
MTTFGASAHAVRKVVELDGIELAIERFGPEGAPAVLLIAGGAQSMDWWTPEFCNALGAGELQVIRYDHRDTGQSSTSPPGRPDYTGDDLAADPLRVLDALSIEKAHLIGLSMGGGIAQNIGVLSPDRVRSLTLVETSPAGGNHDELPPPNPAIIATWELPGPEIDWADQAAVINYRVEVERPYAGSLGFDEEVVRALATLEVRRSRNMESAMTNHFIAESGAAVDPAEIRVPTLILHSAADPMFPLPHGEALAEAIPGARLVRLEGVGHEIPPPAVWDVVMPELHRHLHRT